MAISKIQFVAGDIRKIDNGPQCEDYTQADVNAARARGIQRYQDVRNDEHSLMDARIRIQMRQTYGYYSDDSDDSDDSDGNTNQNASVGDSANHDVKVVDNNNHDAKVVDNNHNHDAKVVDNNHNHDAKVVDNNHNHDAEVVDNNHNHDAEVVDNHNHDAKVVDDDSDYSDEEEANIPLDDFDFSLLDDRDDDEFKPARSKIDEILRNFDLDICRVGMIITPEGVVSLRLGMSLRKGLRGGR